MVDLARKAINLSPVMKSCGIVIFLCRLNVAPSISGKNSTTIVLKNDGHILITHSPLCGYFASSFNETDGGAIAVQKYRLMVFFLSNSYTMKLA